MDEPKIVDQFTGWAVIHICFIQYISFSTSHWLRLNMMFQFQSKSVKSQFLSDRKRLSKSLQKMLSWKATVYFSSAQSEITLSYPAPLKLFLRCGGGNNSDGNTSKYYTSVFSRSKKLSFKVRKVQFFTERSASSHGRPIYFHTLYIVLPDADVVCLGIYLSMYNDFNFFFHLKAKLCRER